MSAPANIVQQLLAPWMNVPNTPVDSAFSNYGGLQGLLNAALQAGNPNSNAAQFGGALQHAQQISLDQAAARQKLAESSIGLQRSLMMLPLQQQYYQGLLGMLAAQGSDQSSQGGDTGSANASTADSGSQTPPVSAPWMDASGTPTNEPNHAIAATPTGAPLAQPAPQGAAAASQPAARRGGPDPLAIARFGAFGGAIGAPGAQGIEDYGKLAAQYDPRLATELAYAKSNIAQDLRGKQEALARGDTQAATLWDNKLLQDAGALQVARNSGIRQQLILSGPNAGQWSMYNPENMTYGLGNSIAPIPGATATKEALAGATARGEAQGQLAEVVDPRTHRSYFVPRSALLEGAGSGGAPAAPAAPTVPGAPGAPAPGGASATPLASLSPGEQGYLEERGRESAKYVTTLQEAADSATTTNYGLDQMIANARNAQLGPGAAARQWVENAVAGFGQQFGMAPPRELSNYEQLDKYANQIAFAATRQMGSREAAQIVELQMRSNPNKQLVPEAFAGLVQSMKAMNNYVIAKNTAIQAQSGADNDSALQAASVWTQRVDPKVWDLSLGPQLASRFAPTLGTAKIATALPFMSHEDGVAVIRNIPASMRAQVLARLPVQVKQEILTAMQQPGGATGGF